MARRDRSSATALGILGIVACTIGVFVQCAPGANAEVKETGQIEAAEQILEGHTFHVGKILVNAPLDRVQGVLRDYEGAHRVYPNVKHCCVVSDKGSVKNIAFTIGAPGNLWKFDYVLEVTDQPGYIEWRRVSGAFKENRGFWRLEPVDGGHATLVTYAKFIDGGLLFPQIFVNRELRTAMPQILSNLKLLAEAGNTVADTNEHALR